MSYKLSEFKFNLKNGNKTLSENQFVFDSTDDDAFKLEEFISNTVGLSSKADAAKQGIKIEEMVGVILESNSALYKVQSVKLDPASNAFPDIKFSDKLDRNFFIDVKSVIYHTKNLPKTLLPVISASGTPLGAYKNVYPYINAGLNGLLNLFFRTGFITYSYMLNDTTPKLFKLTSGKYSSFADSCIRFDAGKHSINFKIDAIQPNLKNNVRLFVPTDNEYYINAKLVNQSGANVKVDYNDYEGLTPTSYTIKNLIYALLFNDEYGPIMIKRFNLDESLDIEDNTKFMIEQLIDHIKVNSTKPSLKLIENILESTAPLITYIGNVDSLYSDNWMPELNVTELNLANKFKKEMLAVSNKLHNIEGMLTWAYALFVKEVKNNKINE